MRKLRCLSFKINCRRDKINLEVNLFNGQSFRWRKVDTGFIGVLHDSIWSLKQNNDSINCTIFTPNFSKNEKEFEDIFTDYFRLNEDVEKHFENWEKSDKHISALLKTFSGLRILRQEPVENIFSFICSSNNNITRISQMIEKLCCNYGIEVGEAYNNIHYTFPTCESLAQPDVEQKLRELGFGYRAKYIYQAACFLLLREKEWQVEQISNPLFSVKPCSWLHNLRHNLKYDEAHHEMMKVPGVGPKVADCICLMSLDKLNAVPIDTHVWQVAKKYYLPQLANNKSLTIKQYTEIGDHFRGLYGDYAGWAHSYLFTSDLGAFSKREEPEKRKRPRT